MNPTNDALVKLASELTDRVDELEKENAALRQQAAQVKQAAAPVTTPVVSEETAAATCDALCKAGALKEEQLKQAKEAYMKDPEAAHRTIQGLLDAMANKKTAAETKDVDLSGGNLVSGKVASRSHEDSCLDRMQAILGMNR